MDIDAWIKIIGSLGFPAALCLGFLWCFYKLGKLLIEFLQRLHDSHEAERKIWYASVDETVKRAMQYQKEEHIEIMGFLRSLSKAG